MRIATLVAASLIVVAAGGTAPQRPAPAPAGFTLKQWTVGGLKRTGLVAVPKTIPAGGAPLVLVFHGHGGTATNMTRAMPINTEWPEAIVIYPQGLPAPGGTVDPEGRDAGWQSEPGALGDRDVRFVDSLVAWARRNYRVDPKRVFAAGHSNGGWFTYVLWATRPDMFAAFAPSSAVFGKMAIGAKPKPAIITAGEKDRLVPFAQQRRSINAVIQLDGAATRGEPWFGGATLHKSGIADVATYVHPGGHPMPANTAAVVVKFFKLR
jgi:polyhydroxybutyrate depolymerase